jgi:anti-anti-sigma factor
MNDFRYSLRGDIDVAAAPVLRADLKLFVTVSDKNLLIDCGDMSYIDAAPIAVLLETQRDLQAVGRRLRVVNAKYWARRTFELFGLSDLLSEDPSNGGEMLANAS